MGRERELAMPMQNRWMPNRQQNTSYPVGLFIANLCVKVIPTQMMAAPSQKMLPLRVMFVLREAVGAVVEGQRGLAAPQRTVPARANMQEEKLLATTNLPMPMIGRQLRAQEMQQLMIHPGRAGGLETTFSQWRMMQLTKMFRKMKQASRQQNSTSVQPTIRIIPTPYPSSRKWMVLKKPFTHPSICVPRPSVAAQKSRSMAGQEQMIRKTAPYALRLLTQSLQSEGSRKAQVKQRKAMINSGMRKFPTERPFSFAFTSTTTAPKTTQNPQKRQSLQKLSPKMVSRMSRVSSTSTKVTMVPIRSPLPSSRLTTWQANTISDSFHSSHEQIRLMATPTAELGPLLRLVNMAVESVYAAVSVQLEILKELLQQQEACVPTARQSMAHTPMLIPIARMKTHRWMKQFDLEGASSRSSASLPSSWQALASVQAGLAGSAGGQRCISTEAGLLPWVYMFNYIMNGSSLVHPIKYPATQRTPPS